MELLCKFFVTAMIVNYIFRLKDKAALFLKENFVFKEFYKKKYVKSMTIFTTSINYRRLLFIFFLPFNVALILFFINGKIKVDEVEKEER